MPQRPSAEPNTAPGPQPAATPEVEQHRKTRVLTQGTPSITRSIADAVVIKDGNLFFLSTATGTVPLWAGHGLGLYYNDCRYLKGYALSLAGQPPTVLVATAGDGYRAVFELTNPDLTLDDGTIIEKETVGLTWVRTLHGTARTLYDELTLTNYGLKPVTVPITFEFRAEFEDVFTVRELVDERPGRLMPPAWDDGVLRFTYEGADGLCRAALVYWNPAPAATSETTVQYFIALEPRAQVQLAVTTVVVETPDAAKLNTEANRPSPHPLPRELATTQMRASFAEVQCDSLLLNRILDGSIRDLGVLRSRLDGEMYLAAGVPWYGTLFGRDSLLTAYQTLAYNPDLAEQTLRLLARYQGQQVDDWRDEQPGKILHELRVGELARLRDIPHTPYYGTVDATPLFLIVLAQHAEWTGRLDLFESLRDNVERALAWIDRYGDEDGDGYVEYRCHSSRGLINQGWKDSGDSVVNSDGSLGESPIALSEVQGYVYWAKLGIAALYERTGDAERAAALRQQAQALREQFNRDFWLEDLGCYALALQAGNRPADVVASNAGQVLWTGIADDDKAQRTVDRLMQPDMFNGWGIRTLSSQARRYNPIGYHLGTVWPHDTALIAAGFRRYSRDEEAVTLTAALAEAASHMEHDRLPELFSGFDRREYNVPVSHPVACHPQAWAAATMPFLMQVCLGLVPRAFDKQLRIVRPHVPAFVDRVSVRGLRVGKCTVELHFTRTEGTQATATVVRVDGELDVVIEPQG